MDQEVINQLKNALNEFPQFLQSLVKKPLTYIDRETFFMWPQILLFTFLVEAITNLAFNIMIMNVRGAVDAVIFMPIQTLMFIGLISFVLGFIFDKMNLTNISYMQTFKLLCFSEMIVHIFVLPLLVVMVYLRSAEVIYGVGVVVILAKAYLVYRGFSRQFLMANKRAFGIVTVFAILFLIQPATNYIQGFHIRQEARNARKMHDQQMEKSIEEIEKDLGESAD